MQGIMGAIGLAVYGAISCGMTAREKGRNVTAWILLGFCFGLIALIVVSLLKDLNKDKYPFRVLFDDSNSQDEKPSVKSAGEEVKSEDIEQL